MARIRSIKPDTWSDPELVRCSPLARLLFIGTWNFADDYGVLKDDPGKLKLQILPGDQCDPEALVDELVKANLLLRRTAPDGTPVLVIRTFTVHQKIDSRATGRWGHPDDFTTRDTPPDPADAQPIPPNPADSPAIPTTPNHTKGTEGKKRDVGRDGAKLALVGDKAPPAAAERASPGSVRAVFDAWVTATGRTAQTRLDPKRDRLIRRALRDFPIEDVTDAVRGWRHSSFHRGENDRHTPYNDLDLLLRDAARIEKFRDLERGALAPTAAGEDFAPASETW